MILADTVAVVVDTAKAVVDSTVVSTSNSLIYIGGGAFLAVVVILAIVYNMRDKGFKVVAPK